MLTTFNKYYIENAAPCIIKNCATKYVDIIPNLLGLSEIPNSYIASKVSEMTKNTYPIKHIKNDG